MTRTSEYALRALIYLAQHVDEWPIAGNHIAQEAGVPAKYLSKVLGDLVRVGVLTGTRGKRGGFRMVHPPEETRLADVLGPFEQLERRHCPFGNQECSDKKPCLAHHEWRKVVAAERQFLQVMTVADVATAKRRPGAGRRRRRG